MRKDNILEKLSMTPLAVKVTIAAVIFVNVGFSIAIVINTQNQSRFHTENSNLSAITTHEEDENKVVVGDVNKEPQSQDHKQQNVEEIANDPQTENLANDSHDEPETSTQSPLELQATILPKPTIPEKDEAEEYIPPQPEEIPDYLVGNSGKVFVTLEEAMEWAIAEETNPDSQWYGCVPSYRSVSLSPIGRDEDPWTVDF